MSLGLMIQTGGAQSGIADVDTLSQMKVALAGSTALSGIHGAGYAALAGVMHDGTAQPLSISNTVNRSLRPAQITYEGRLRTGLDSHLWNEQFNHAITPVSAWQVTTSTMTTAIASGFWQFNSGNATATGNVARAQTYRYFSPSNNAPVVVDFNFQLSAVVQTNAIIEFGLFLASSTTAPTDGIGFRINGAGSFEGFINYNGTEGANVTFTGAVLPASQLISCRLIWGVDRVEFWINEIYAGSFNALGSAGAGVVLSQSLPITIRQYNNGAAGGAIQYRLGNVKVQQRDEVVQLPHSVIAALSGLGGYNLPPGTTAGGTINYANSAAPSSLTLSNTASGLTITQMGGQFQFAAVAGAETDYAIVGFQVPAGTAAVPGRSFVWTGICIDTMNTGAAVATTETWLQWGGAVGSTAVSLATADSATAGTRAPRRFMLGNQVFAIAAAIGAQAAILDKNWGLDAARIVEPGTFLHVILKIPRGSATASQVIRGTIEVRGFFI